MQLILEGKKSEAAREQVSQFQPYYSKNTVLLRKTVYNELEIPDGKSSRTYIQYQI